MFELIRTHRRWMQFILLLLIVPSFVLVGMQSYSSFIDSEVELAVISDQGIKQSEFDMAHRNQLEQFRQRLGSQFDPAVLDTPAMRQQLLDQLIDQRLLALVAQDNRFSVSDTTLRDTIAAIPQVQEDGRFSPERYRQVLAAQGLSPTSFENGLRRDLAVARVLEPIGLSASVPQVVVEDIQAALTQKRSIQLRRFDAADYRAKITITPQDLQTWYDANKDSLRIPEQVQVDYLVLDEAAATQGVQVKDEDIASYYEQNKHRFGTPEQRRASHILIELPPGASQEQRTAARERAESLAAEAAANPAAFADLARKSSQDAGSAAQGGDLGWIAGGSVPPTVAKAIAELPKDGVSGVVESPFGLHILKVTDIKPAVTKPLAEVKDQITSEIRKQLASARFAEMATKLQGAVYDHRDSLQPAADALGLKLRHASGVTRSGLLPASQTEGPAASGSADSALLDNPRVRQALFANEVLREKQNTGVIELSPDTMLALRVADVQPAHVPPLDKVKSVIEARLLDERAAQAAHEAGEAALKTLQADGGTEGFGPVQTIWREQPSDLPRSVLDAVMRMDPAKLPGYTGVAAGADFILVRLDGVEAGQSKPDDAKNLARQLAGAWGEAEDQAVLNLLRDLYKVKVMPPAAAVVQGDQPAEG